MENKQIDDMQAIACNMHEEGALNRYTRPTAKSKTFGRTWIASALDELVWNANANSFEIHHTAPSSTVIHST